MFFRIIIPNYNNGAFLRQCIDSVLNQSFKDFEIIIVDDVSTDNSREIIKEYEERHYNIKAILLEEKKWNGGSRNEAIKVPTDSTYTMFLDSDDWFDDDSCLQTIYDIIINNNYPDCVRLSYNCLIGKNKWTQLMKHDTPEKLVNALEVACWTKCIKTNLIQLFPENTLMEDVVQHIKQCDKLNEVVLCLKPIVNWNRNNPNSCSKEENQNCQQGKWQSSIYRYAADLMDTVCEHDYCEKHRQWRLDIALKNIKDGKYIQ